MRFKKLFLFLVGMGAVSAPTLAWAQSPTTSSAAGFSIPSGDISIGLLTQVLGVGWQNWISGGSTSGAW
jgi:hypothetical protein